MAARVSGAGTSASPRPSVGDELELRIDSLAFGGAGVARTAEGYVVFVDGAFPGDLVRARVHHRKRAFAQARSCELIEPGPDRVPALAEHPGAPWQELAYARQLEIKHAQVEEALRRIGHLEGFELEPIVAAVEQWRYRNKLEYSFGRGAAGELVCGFHAPGSWERIEPLEDCLLASERGNEVRRAVVAWAREQRLEPFDRRERTGLLRNLVVREGRRSGLLQVRIVTTHGELEAGALAQALSESLGDSLCGVLWTRSSSLAETTGGGETELVWGEAKLPERLGELDLQISAEAFFQTNTEMAERLYGIVAEYAALEGWERVYDLFSGIGTIAMTLAPRAGELWGIELIEQAVADAIDGARANAIAKASFFAGDARLALPELLQRAGRPDVLVVDPPRAGLSKKVVHRIVDCSPKRIVYVSCNPTTLAPNAAELVDAGWTLRKVRPVDMFPQTHHIECVAVLERS